jgi:hypothetical protein
MAICVGSGVTKTDSPLLVPQLIGSHVGSVLISVAAVVMSVDTAGITSSVIRRFHRH